MECVKLKINLNINKNKIEKNNESLGKIKFRGCEVSGISQSTLKFALVAGVIYLIAKELLEKVF